MSSLDEAKVRKISHIELIWEKLLGFIMIIDLCFVLRSLYHDLFPILDNNALRRSINDSLYINLLLCGSLGHARGREVSDYFSLSYTSSVTDSNHSLLCSPPVATWVV